VLEFNCNAILIDVCKESGGGVPELATMSYIKKLIYLHYT